MNVLPHVTHPPSFNAGSSKPIHIRQTIFTIMKIPLVKISASCAAIITSSSAIVTMKYYVLQWKLVENLLGFFERRLREHLVDSEFYRPLSRFLLRSPFLLFVFYLTSTTNIYSSVMSIYTPSLTGLYNVGEPTIKTSQMSFSWSGPDPRYMTYEIFGKLRGPLLTNSVPQVSILHNGSFLFQPRPGLAWGFQLGSNFDIKMESLGQHLYHTYDAVSGEFYFYVQTDVITNYSNGVGAWEGTTNKYLATADVLIGDFPIQGDAGAVFIESARMSVSDESFPPSAQQLNILVAAPSSFMNVANVPEPTSIVMTMLASGFMLIRRKR